MIASDPQTYRQYIEQIKPANDEQREAKTKALNVADIIDSQRRKVSTDPAGNKDQDSNFTKLLDKLATYTAILSSGDGGSLPASTQPEYGGLTRAGFARSMRIRKLTRIVPPGTGPGVANPVWENLNLRAKGNGKYYLRGHLLNEQLHGSGTTWQNITPLSQGRSNRNTRDYPGDG